MKTASKGGFLFVKKAIGVRLACQQKHIIVRRCVGAGGGGDLAAIR